MFSKSAQIGFISKRKTFNASYFCLSFFIQNKKKNKGANLGLVSKLAKNLKPYTYEYMDMI